MPIFYLTVFIHYLSITSVSISRSNLRIPKRGNNVGCRARMRQNN